MAQQPEGRRDVVQDPLRQSVQAGAQLQEMAIGLVRGPDRPNMSGMSAETESLNRAMTGLNGVLNDMFEKEIDTAMTDGKVAFMSGVTEQELLKNGNRYTQMGYLQLKARNDVNNWYLQEQADLVDKSNSMDPASYQKYLSEKRKTFLDGIEDPYARKVAVASFEQLNPDLASKQFTQNNAFNYDQRKQGFREYLRTGVAASPSSGRVIPGDSTLTIQPTAVEPVMNTSVMDRDLGIRTLIGEAGNQGDFGMAAVAHVIRNRATDSRYPQSIAGVVRQKNQFSVWNNGKEGSGGSLMSLSPESATYQKAAKVYDAVMSGRHIDPTGGALFYHSPKGMKAYADKGIQVSQATLSRVGAAESDPNSIVIQDHVFYGRTDGKRRQVRDMVEPEEQGDTSGDETKYVDPMVKVMPRGAADELLPTKQLNEAPRQEAVAGIKEVGVANETMDMAVNYAGLKPEDKVELLSEEMASAFLSGSDSLFENVGGLATLRKLGATAAQIDKVVRSRDKFLDDQDKKFDEGQLQFNDKILRMADDPNANADEILATIRKEYEGTSRLDTTGRALAAQALATMRSNDKSEATTEKAQAEKDARYERWSNKDFQQEVGQAYQRILSNEMELPAAQAMTDDIAERYGLDKQDIATLMGNMFEKDQQRQNGLRNDAEQRIKATQQSEVRKGEVREALGRGTGLKGMNEQVKIVNEDGTTSTMSQKEYGIQIIKQDALMKFGEDQAAIAAYVFPKLQAQGVVDSETLAQSTGALAGEILQRDEKGNKTGKITKDAEAAYGLYANLRRNNVINPDFIADQFSNTYVRSLLETAYSLDAGMLTGPEALIRAKEMADNKEIDPAYQNRTDKELDKALEGAGAAFVQEQLAGGWADWMNTSGEQVTNGVAIDANAMGNALKVRALRYRDLNPWQPAEAALEMAKQDLAKETKRIAGNLVLSPTDLAAKAGLERTEDLDKAMGHYLMQNAGALFGQTAVDAWKPMAVNPIMPGNAPYGATNAPPVKLMWVESLGQYMAWRITDDKGSVDMGNRALIDPKKVGQEWKDYRAGPGLLNTVRGKFNDNIVQDWKKDEPSFSGSVLSKLYESIKGSTGEFADGVRGFEQSVGQQIETPAQPAF